MGGGTTQQAETSLLDRAQATRKAKPCEPNPSRRRSAHPKTHHTLTSLNGFHERPHPQFVFAAVAKGFEGTGPAGSHTLRSGMVDERLSRFEEVSQRTREPSKQTVHWGFVCFLGRCARCCGELYCYGRRLWRLSSFLTSSLNS